jgi:hypothetical protein
MAKDAKIELVSVDVQGESLAVKVKIVGLVSNKVGDRVVWARVADYTLDTVIPFTDLIQGWGASERISNAGKLRDTSANFVESITGKTFTPKVLDALIEANRLPSGDLDKKEAELLAKLEAIQAAKAKRDSE